MPSREDWTSQPRDVCAVQRTRDWPAALGAASEGRVGGLVEPSSGAEESTGGSELLVGSGSPPAVTAPRTSCLATRQPCL